MAASGKQAVVFILDSSSSMGHTPYYAGGDSTSASTTANQSTATNQRTSRLDCAKQALQVWISDLMIQSKQHEVAVVVCKTMTTCHHLSSTHFPNLTVLPVVGAADEGDNEEEEAVLVQQRQQECDSDDDSDASYAKTSSRNAPTTTSIGMTRPTVDLLRQVQEVHCSELLPENNNNTTPLRGDLMDGLVVAADVLRQRTLGKKYSRSIVILTDACHQIVIDEGLVLQVVDSLRHMDCQLHVIGLDFKESAVFDDALPESEAVEDSDDDAMSGEESEGSETDDDDDDEISDNDENQQRDTERFLISIARLTGGSVRAASSLHQVLQQNLGKRIPTSTRRKVQLHIASIMELDVRVSLLLSKTNLPTLKKEAILLDETNAPLRDGLGNYVTSELETATDHFDAIQKDVGVDEAARTKAVKYGSDWIPLNDFDMQGLKERSDVCITILGYTPQSNIPRGYRMGPPYGVAGSETRARAAVGALAQALYRLESCAIGTYVKSKHADPILVALFPLVESSSSDVTTRNDSDATPAAPQHLVLLQLPYSGDVPKMVCSPLNVYVEHAAANTNKQKACDDLIDSMMLSDHPTVTPVLDSTRIPNPAIRSFRKTLVQRAIMIRSTTKSTIVEARGEWFDVPFLDAQPVFDAFRKAFPIIETPRVK